MRGIERKIDFILRAVVPKKPAYRVNSTETKEIQRQVEKLIEKSYLRESLSPCSVSVLLEPKKDETWCMCVESHQQNHCKVSTSYS